MLGVLFASHPVPRWFLWNLQGLTIFKMSINSMRGRFVLRNGGDTKECFVSYFPPARWQKLHPNSEKKPLSLHQQVPIARCNFGLLQKQIHQCLAFNTVFRQVPACCVHSVRNVDVWLTVLRARQVLKRCLVHDPGFLRTTLTQTFCTFASESCQELEFIEPSRLTIWEHGLPNPDLRSAGNTWFFSETQTKLLAWSWWRTQTTLTRYFSILTQNSSLELTKSVQLLKVQYEYHSATFSHTWKQKVGWGCDQLCFTSCAVRTPT